MIYISYCWSRIWDTLEKILHVAHPNGAKGVETQIPLLTSFFELVTHPLISFSCCWAHIVKGWYHNREQRGSVLPAPQEPKGIPGLAAREQGRAEPNILTKSQTHQASQQVPGQAWQGLYWVQWSLAGPKSRPSCRAGVEKQMPWVRRGLAAAELPLQSPGLSWNGALGQGWGAGDAPAETAQGS